MCLLLIGLWARSYWWTDSVCVHNYKYAVDWLSAYGVIKLEVTEARFKPSYIVQGRVINDYVHRISFQPYGNSWEPIGQHSYISLLGFGLRNYLPHQDGSVFYCYTFPFWFVVLLAATFAAIPWVKWWSFSLRTMLIATTLIAVVLAIIGMVL